MRTEEELRAEIVRLRKVLAKIQMIDVNWDLINSRIWALQWVLETEEQ